MEPGHGRPDRTTTVIKLAATQEVVSDTAPVVALSLQDDDANLLDRREIETTLT